MSILNRRNAVLGWAVWKVATNVAQSKAKHAVKHDESKPGLVRRVAIIGVGFAVATGAALVFWRKKSDDTPPVL
jgi:high-affinity Fe2+/Pb2+ permease